MEVPWNRVGLLSLPKMHGQCIVVYLQASNLLLVLSNQLLELLNLLVSPIMLLLALVLNCNGFL